MEKKIIFGTLGGAVALMIVAMIIFMGLMGGTVEKWTTENAACLNDMNPVWWIVGSLLQGLLLTLLLNKFGVRTPGSGAVAGTWITLLLTLWYGIMTASTFQAYTWSWLPMDVIGNTVAGALAGAVIGWILDKVN